MTLDEYDYATHRWGVRPFELPNSDEYLYDIDNISMAMVGAFDAYGSNTFFEEACQLIANSIQLFKLGYFDAAFYSLRQSIETSIGTLYLTANPDKMKDWCKYQPGFESGTMVAYLKQKESVFKGMTDIMSPFFKKVRDIQLKTNKYVHKQGYNSFYSTKRIISSDPKSQEPLKRIREDFVTTLKTAIGAVGVYRLAIDPLPVLLMDEDVRLRTGDLITEPYSQEFVDNYIGQDTIELYKQTELYNSYKESLLANEKQSEAIYNLIHFQYIDRKAEQQLVDQAHLLSIYDCMAVCYVFMSDSISRVFLCDFMCYTTNTKPVSYETTMGNGYFKELFEGKQSYNLPMSSGAFMSRFKVGGQYSYIESNTILSDAEIVGLEEISKLFDDKIEKANVEIKELIREVNQS